MHRNSAIRNVRQTIIAALAVASATGANGQTVPAELSALLTKAGVDGTVTAWCRGEFRAGHGGAYAAAIRSMAGPGRYLILEPDVAPAEFATFSGTGDMSCYTPADARKLDRSIRASATIHGAIKPRWNTTVVCAFVDNTTSVCWQYSPRKRALVKIGDWVT